MIVCFYVRLYFIGPYGKYDAAAASDALHGAITEEDIGGDGWEVYTLSGARGSAPDDPEARPMSCVVLAVPAEMGLSPEELAADEALVMQRASEALVLPQPADVQAQLPPAN